MSRKLVQVTEINIARHLEGAVDFNEAKVKRQSDLRKLRYLPLD
jgi:hypothetical protein